MSVDREELKRMIDQIPEQDALEVYDFIEYLNMKRKKEKINELEIECLAKDDGLLSQVIPVLEVAEDEEKSIVWVDGIKHMKENVYWSK